MILCKIFFQLIVTVLQKRPKLTATLLYLTVVLLLYLKQYFFSKKLERTGLEPMWQDWWGEISDKFITK